VFSVDFHRLLSITGQGRNRKGELEQGEGMGIGESLGFKKKRRPGLLLVPLVLYPEFQEREVARAKVVLLK